MPIRRYGLVFNENYNDLDIELACIAARLAPLEQHFENARKLMWPGLDDHRWHRLCRDNIINHKVSVLLGCASSGKTHEAAWTRLTEYFASPDDTLILVSSTDIRGLQLRVFGEIKMLFEKAKELWPNLPGTLVESKLAICTDDLDEDKARDLRKGIIGIPCFPSGELVDTPNGMCPIEHVKVGQTVMNACGLGRVTALHKTISETLVRVSLRDGRSIDCTPEHPFFTNRGWVNAVDLTTCDKVLSVNETLSILRQPPRSWIPQQKILLSEMQDVSQGEDVFHVRGSISALEENWLFWTVLLHRMCRKVGCGKQVRQACYKEMQTLQDYNERCSLQQRFLFCRVSQSSHYDALRTLRSGFCFNKGITAPPPHSMLQHSLQAIYSGEKVREGTHQDDERGVDGVEAFPAIDGSLPYSERPCRQGWKARLVSGGYCLPGNKTCCRGGWGYPPRTTESTKRQSEDGSIEGTWVDCVTILEPSSDPRFDRSSGGYPVYNLSVDGHPSYSVNGAVVHNCVQNGKFVGLGKYAGIKQVHMRLIADEAQFMGGSFLSAFANLDKNVDFMATVLGNANDPMDPLGKAAEPLDGWSRHMEPTKTSVWKTKFMNGVCVNLIGTDSPNFDFPENEPERYPYLISREKIKNTLSFFAADSVEYYSQCVGAMKVGVLLRRVITRDLCEQFKAKDDVVWSGSDLTRIFGMDSAYGGDRCVGGHIDFGRTVNGSIAIRVSQPQIVPVKARRKEDDPQPEDQIAEWVKEYCDTHVIPPENVFHDSTGRGGLGTAIARVFSDQCSGIEFGGAATPRPVSLDLWVYDMKEKKKRLKLCGEHYDRFVTELWFSVRLAIEGGQLKHIPEDVMEEMCMREWDKVKENRIRVETKKEMKERVGRSPDLGDWLSICVEGARRKGFQIAKLANEEAVVESNQWIGKLAQRQRHLTERHSLNYTA